MFGLRASDLEQIREALRNFPEIEEAFIYGSRAMGNYKPGSDVDIAIKGSIQSEIVIALSAELNEILNLPYRFDVTNYAELTDQSLKDHIDQFGQSFYKRNS